MGKRVGMKLEDYTITVSVKVHIPLWEAIKMRIAGIDTSRLEEVGKKAEEEDMATRRARRKEEEQKSKEESLKIYLRHSPGMCPDCRTTYPLMTFRVTAISAGRVNDEE